MMESEDSSEDESFDPEQDPDKIVERDFEAEKISIINNLLPKKSRASYEVAYSLFLKWMDQNRVDKLNEDVILVYFKELSKTRKPSTLWSVWSKLRTLLSLRNGININNYNLLKTFMRNSSKGYKPKKSRVLTWLQITSFISNSEDQHYLLAKTVLIFGVFGALRCIELINLCTTDVEDLGNQYIVTIEDTKNNYPRQYVIGKQFYQVVKKYISLRPAYMPGNRLFVRYEAGKCKNQFLGKNKVSEIPKTIALYLNLDKPEEYTGHCFRRSAATALSNAGANLLMVKQLGGWRGDATAQGYIENSLANREAIFNKLCSNSNQQENGKNNSTVPSSTITSNSLPEIFLPPNVREEQVESVRSTTITGSSFSQLKNNQTVSSSSATSNSSLPRITLLPKVVPSTSTTDPTFSTYLEPIKETNQTCRKSEDQQQPTKKIRIDNKEINELLLDSSMIFQNCTIHKIIIYKYPIKNKNEENESRRNEENE